MVSLECCLHTFTSVNTVAQHPSSTHASASFEINAVRVVVVTGLRFARCLDYSPCGQGFHFTQPISREIASRPTGKSY